MLGVSTTAYKLILLNQTVRGESGIVQYGDDVGLDILKDRIVIKPIDKPGSQKLVVVNGAHLNNPFVKGTVFITFFG